MRERFRPVVFRRGGTAMVLRRQPSFEPVTVSSIVRERVIERRATSFAPRLVLNVYPRFTVSDGRSGITTVRTVHARPTVVRAPSSGATVRPSREPSRVSEIPQPESVTRLAPPPLERVVRRLRPPDSPVTMRRTTRPEQVTTREQEERRELVRRVVRRTRRVEERSLAVIERRLRRSPAPPPETPPGTSSPAFPAPRPAAGPWGRPAPPQVDVGAIADQVMRKIDHRLTAWRERTGRV